MRSFFEMPEYQVFHVFREGDLEPCGPYSQDQLVWLLNQDALARSDLVYYPGLDTWRPLHEVFDFHERVANFQADGHDDGLVNAAFLELSRLCRHGEELFDIATQEKSVFAPLRVKVVAVSSHGLWLGSLGRKGDFEGGRVEWDEIDHVSAHFPLRWDQGVLAVALACGSGVEVNRLPRRPLRRIVSMARDIAARHWTRQWERSPDGIPAYA
jgi:hypothetical protein